MQRRTTPEYAREVPVTHLSTDVAVIGVGAMGSATLWQLAERGVATIGFEQFEPGHDRGSSHGETRIYRTAYLEGPGYVPLAQRAVEHWRRLQELSGESLIEPVGALMIGPGTSPVIVRTLMSIQVHGLDHRLLDAGDIRRQYPAHQVADDDVAIHEHNAGILRPERSIVAAARRAAELGAQLIRHVGVERIEPCADGVRISAGDLSCDARHAVVAAGTWLPKLLPELALPIRVTRQVVGWFRIDRPAWFAPDRFPVFLRDLELDSATADSTFYGFPTTDGLTIKASIHREGEPADPDTLNRTVTAADVSLHQESIRRFLAGVDPEVVRTSVCMYANTPDHDFLIGSPPGLPAITILGGFSGHGFKFAPVIGEAAADLATTGLSDLPVQWLSPTRFLGERALGTA
jgi:sarcosine oxidase